MKAEDKKQLKSILIELAKLSSKYDDRISDYEENDKENTQAYEKCTDESYTITSASEELADLCGIDFDEIKENIYND